MINCPKCNAEIDSDSPFCDMCGQEIFYCTSCGRPGKGNRCTSCGGVMARIDEIRNDLTARSHVTKREGLNAAAQNANKLSRTPQLYLINETLHIRLAAVDGAILGRRQGVYQEYLAACPYISGNHALLSYSPTTGWTITDRNSSNGTWVNKEKLLPNEPMPLKNNDHLLLANVEFKIDIINKP